MISPKVSTGNRFDNRVSRIAITLLIVVAAITAGVWRLTGTSAEGPTLEISYPAQAEVGGTIEISLLVRNASGIGGYQTRLLYDTSAAHLAGVDHAGNGIAGLGRFVQTLGPNEFDGGASFGLYSCPLDECNSGGKPVDRGADGDVSLATIYVTPDQAGTLTLEFSSLRFTDASGSEVDVQTGSLTLSVNVVEGQE